MADADGSACGLKRDAEGKCVPCESMDKSSLLSPEALAAAVAAEIPLWQIKQHNGNDSVMIFSRSFTAKNFVAAMAALNDMGNICEALGHHAVRATSEARHIIVAAVNFSHNDDIVDEQDFHLTSYREVEIVVYTHSVKGCTRNDVELCLKVNTAGMYDRANKAAKSSVARRVAKIRLKLLYFHEFATSFRFAPRITRVP